MLAFNYWRRLARVLATFCPCLSPSMQKVPNTIWHYPFRCPFAPVLSAYSATWHCLAKRQLHLICICIAIWNLLSWTLAHFMPSGCFPTNDLMVFWETSHQIIVLLKFCWWDDSTVIILHMFSNCLMTSVTSWLIFVLSILELLALFWLHKMQKSRNHMHWVYLVPAIFSAVMRCRH